MTCRYDILCVMLLFLSEIGARVSNTDNGLELEYVKTTGSGIEILTSLFSDGR